MTTLVDHVEVRYRPSASQGVFQYLKIPPSQGTVLIPGVERGMSYDVEARSISARGTASNWVPVTHTVAAANLPLGTPASMTVSSLADGVHVAWLSGDTVLRSDTEFEVWRAPDVSGVPGAFALLTTIRGFAFTDPTTDSVTRWYQVREKDQQGNYSGFTAAINSAGNGVSAAVAAAQNTANAANTGAHVQNPVFLTDLSGWSFSTPANFYQQNSAAYSPYPLIPTQMVHTGTAGQTLDYASSNTSTAVTPGQVVTAGVALLNSGANAAAYAYAIIDWVDATGAYLSSTNPGAPTIGPGGTYLQGNSRASGVAPANAAAARLSIHYVNHTSGYITATNAYLTPQVASVGEVPDGGGRYAVHAVDGNNLALIDFTQSGHVSKNLGNIADTTTRFAAIQANADNTASNTAADTAHVNGATAASISDGAGRAQLGFDATGYLVSGRHNLGLLAGRTADQLTYTAGGTVDSLKPSVAGADVTSQQLSLSLINPGFEAGTYVSPNLSDTNGTSWHSEVDANGWSIGVSPPVSGTPPPFSGSRCLLYYNAGFAGTPTFTSDTIMPCSAGDYMRVACKVAQNVGTGSPWIVIQFLNGSGYVGQTDTASYTPAGIDVWVDLVGYGVVPAGASYCRVIIGINGYTNSGAWGFDAVQVDRLTPSIDRLPDGTIYSRIYGSELSSGQHKLGVAGSGKILGNQLNAPNSLTLNYGAARTATAVTVTSAGAVSINAYSVNMGGTTVSYNAVSNAITGLTVGSTYQIYCHDAGGTGGTKTWLAYLGDATGLLTLGDDVVLAGQVTVPASGSSGGGGTGLCVCDHMHVVGDRTAGESQPGDVFDCLDLPTQGMRKFRRRLLAVERERVPCVRITTDAGAVLECSLTTPFDVLDGRTVYAPDMLGEDVVTDWGIETVESVEDIGERRVSHIHLGGVSYAAGVDPAHRIYSHNIKP